MPYPSVNSIVTKREHPFLGEDLVLLTYFRPKYMYHWLFVLLDLHRFDAVGESYDTHDAITTLYRVLTEWSPV